MNRLITKYSTTCETMIVTPAIATRLLQSNHPRNRPISLETISRYARDMFEGKWAPGSPLRILDNGHIADGQHRLGAIVKTGLAQELTIIRGGGDEIFLACDRGRARSTGHVAKSMGILMDDKDVAVVRFLFSLSVLANGELSISNRTQFSDRSIFEAYSKMPFVSQVRKEVPSRFHAGVVAAIALESTRRDMSKVLEGLRTGAGLEVDSPILLLREKILDTAVGASTGNSLAGKLSSFLRTANALLHYARKSKMTILKENKAYAKELFYCFKEFVPEAD